MANKADILGSNRKSTSFVRWAEHFQALCAERDKLMARDCSVCGISRAKLDDLADATAEESRGSLSLVAVSATQGTIFEVLAAIRRIEQGTYGICEVTGEPIEAERLMAIPWARYSARGQKELERGARGRRSALSTHSPSVKWKQPRKKRREKRSLLRRLAGMMLARNCSTLAF